MPRERIKKILDSTRGHIEAHGGSMEIGEVNESSVTIYSSGECYTCDNKCIEDAIKEEVPGIDVDFL